MTEAVGVAAQQSGEDDRLPVPRRRPGRPKGRGNASATGLSPEPPGGAESEAAALRRQALSILSGSPSAASEAQLRAQALNILSGGQRPARSPVAGSRARGSVPSRKRSAPRATAEIPTEAHEAVLEPTFSFEIGVAADRKRTSTPNGNLELQLREMPRGVYEVRITSRSPHVPTPRGALAVTLPDGVTSIRIVANASMLDMGGVLQSGGPDA